MKNENHALDQARAQFESINDMVDALMAAHEACDYEQVEEAQQAIYDDPLSVQVRSDWANPGDDMVPVEYCILLCTGGPAVRIVGDLNDWKEPESARMEYQDWFTPWEKYDGANQDVMLQYAQQFYFGK
jgi:hypothetical protein